MEESRGPHLQVSSGGVNVAVQQQGQDIIPEVQLEAPVNVQDTVEDVSSMAVTGAFSSVQFGDESNILFSRADSDDEMEAAAVRGSLPHAKVTTKDNLHYIIDSPNGVIQIGRCCVLLKINFSSEIVRQLLNEGDLQVRLQSSDVLLRIQWSNWDSRIEEILSRIKVEIKTEFQERRDEFETQMLRALLAERDQYRILRNITNNFFERFGARLCQITGGCLELWIWNPSQLQLEKMKSQKVEIEKMLTEEFTISYLGSRYDCTVTFLDAFADTMEEAQTAMPPLGVPTFTRQVQKGQQIEQMADRPVTRAEMEEFVDRVVTKKLETVQKSAEAEKTKVVHGGEMLAIGKKELRELIATREPEHKTKGAKVVLSNEEILGNLQFMIEDILRRKLEYLERTYMETEGKHMTKSSEEFIRSKYQEIMKELESLLSVKQQYAHMDVDAFRIEARQSLYSLNEFLIKDLKRISAFKKERLTGDEIRELETRLKPAVNGFMQTIISEIPKTIQVTEKHIKEGYEYEETKTKTIADEDKEQSTTFVPQKHRPAGEESMRARKEELLQEATQEDKEFMRIQLDLYEIFENPNSTLPIGTRVEPVSKRARLQASIRKEESQETVGGLEYGGDIYGTVVNHVSEDDEQVQVNWDNSDSAFMYHETNAEALSKQIPRKLLLEDQAAIGVYVERGPNWKFEDQGGPYGIGTVIRYDKESGIVQVKWHGVRTGWNSYRIGEDVETRQECFLDGDFQSSDS